MTITSQPDHTVNSPLRPERLWLVFVGIVLGCVVSNPILQQMIWIDWEADEFFVYVYVGWIVSQPIMLGIWAALGPGPALHRLTFMLIGQAVLAFSSSHEVRNLEDLVNGRPEIEVALLIGQCLTFVIIGVAAWLFGRLFGWRIACPSWFVESSPPRTQFSLKHALGMMTIWAVMLAVYSSARYSGSWPQTYREWIVRTSSFCLLVALPAISLPLVMLLSRITVVGVAVALLLTTLVPPLLLRCIDSTWPLGGAANFRNAAALAFSALAGGSLAAGILRWAGYRLFRVKNNKVDPSIP